MKRVQQRQRTHDDDNALRFEGDSDAVNPKRPRIEKDNGAAREIMKSYEEFADSQVWLTDRSTQSDDKTDEMPCIIYPVFLEETDKCAWLLKGSNGDFAMVTADDGNDTSMIEHEDNGSAHTIAVEAYFTNILNSPNVTWIKPKSNKAPVGVSRHHLEKSTHSVSSGSIKDWLRKSPACPQDEQPMDVQGNNVCSTSQKPPDATESEDLAGLACVQETPTRDTIPCQPMNSSPQRGEQEKKASEGDWEQTPCCSTSSPGSKGTQESSKDQWLQQDPPCTEGPPTAAEVESAQVGMWLVSDTYPTKDYQSTIISGFLKCQSEDYLVRPKKPYDVTISESWLLDGGKTKTGKDPMVIPQQDVTEKWLVAQASRSSRLQTRATGFPYFTLPMDVNQWLQK